MANPASVGYGTNVTYPTHHSGQVATPIYVNHQADDAEFRTLVFNVDTLDGAIRHRDGVGHFGTHAPPPLELNSQLYRKLVGNILGPLQMGQPGATIIVLRQPGTGV